MSVDTDVVSPAAAPDLDGVAAVAAKALATPAVSFADLMAKPVRTLSFPVVLADGEGTRTLTMKYRAIVAKEYDRLLEANPPSAKEKAAGAIYHLDTFAPALIAAVSAEPRLSIEQATALYENPQWSGGELSTLFYNAQRVCNTGLDIPFNARD